jgi:hypothetical protein
MEVIIIMKQTRESIIRENLHFRDNLHFMLDIDDPRTHYVLRVVQMIATIIIFLLTYLQHVVVINFQSAGANDALTMFQGIANKSNNYYFNQGSDLFSFLNHLMGGNLWSTYRYAINSSQFMQDPVGLKIMIWSFLLILISAFCILTHFFKEHYVYRYSLAGAIAASIFLILTPLLIHHWANQFAINKHLSLWQANQIFSVDYLAYFAIFCSLIVLSISIVRFYKHF